MSRPRAKPRPFNRQQLLREVRAAIAREERSAGRFIFQHFVHQPSARAAQRQFRGLRRRWHAELYKNKYFLKCLDGILKKHPARPDAALEAAMNLVNQVKEIRQHIGRLDSAPIPHEGFKAIDSAYAAKEQCLTALDDLIRDFPQYRELLRHAALTIGIELVEPIPGLDFYPGRLERGTAATTGPGLRSREGGWCPWLARELGRFVPEKTKERAAQVAGLLRFIDPNEQRRRVRWTATRLGDDLHPRSSRLAGQTEKKESRHPTLLDKL